MQGAGALDMGLSLSAWPEITLLTGHGYKVPSTLGSNKEKQGKTEP